MFTLTGHHLCLFFIGFFLITFESSLHVKIACFLQPTLLRRLHGFWTTIVNALPLHLILAQIMFPQILTFELRLAQEKKRASAIFVDSDPTEFTIFQVHENFTADLEYAGNIAAFLKKIPPVINSENHEIA